MRGDATSTDGANRIALALEKFWTTRGAHHVKVRVTSEDGVPVVRSNLIGGLPPLLPGMTRAPAMWRGLKFN